MIKTVVQRENVGLVDVVAPVGWDWRRAAADPPAPETRASVADNHHVLRPSRCSGEASRGRPGHRSG